MLIKVIQIKVVSCRVRVLAKSSANLTAVTSTNRKYSENMREYLPAVKSDWSIVLETGNFHAEREDKNISSIVISRFTVKQEISGTWQISSIKFCCDANAEVTVFSWPPGGYDLILLTSRYFDSQRLADFLVRLLDDEVGKYFDSQKFLALTINHTGRN